MSKIFRILKGAWRLRKLITDRRGHNSFKIKGKAVFSEVGENELLFKEKGEFDSPSAKNNVEVSSSEYLYVYEDESINVYFFDKGKRQGLFHKLNPEGRSESVFGCHHQCNRDSHSTEYHFFSDKKFQIKHTVLGPRKDYVSETIYEREMSSNGFTS